MTEARPTLCTWCQRDDPEGCERLGATCIDLREAWDREWRAYLRGVDVGLEAGRELERWADIALCTG